MLHAAAEFPVAISRRNGASRADEIILLLNLFGGTIFSFRSLKALTGFESQSSNSQSSALTKGHVLAKYGLQFFTISMSKGHRNQLKVLTPKKVLRRQPQTTTLSFLVQWNDSQQVR
jgi:hypothetical protein